VSKIGTLVKQVRNWSNQTQKWSFTPIVLATRQARTTTKAVKTVVTLTNPSFQALATAEHFYSRAMGQNDDILEIGNSIFF